MKIMYEYLLFDLDGTLVDSAPGIFSAIKYACRMIEFDNYKDEILIDFLGPPLKTSFMNLMGLPEEMADKAVDIYRKKYESSELYNSSLFDDVEKMLIYLKSKGKKIVLATAKPEKFAKIILEHFGIMKYFDFVGGASLDLHRAEKAQVIAYVLENLSVEDKSKVIMIGDRKDDINGAHKNEIDSIGVLYGYGSEVEHRTAGAKYIAKSITEIIHTVIEPKK